MVAGGLAGSSAILVRPCEARGSPLASHTRTSIALEPANPPVLQATGMEINCYFQKIVGGQCSQDKRSRAKGKGALMHSLLSNGKDSLRTRSVCQRN